MIELSIRFTSAEKEENEENGPIYVSLFRPDSGSSTDPIPFEPPLGDDELKEIRWYLESFSVWPSGPDYARAQRIESKLEEWGAALLESVTSGREASRIWERFFGMNGDKQITIDATDPRVLRLPWELMADEAGHLFAQEISVRRRLRKTTESKIKELDLPVRILMVTSRPDDAGFIDPRADAIALLDATDSLGDQVEVEFLYPPTLKALTNRLRDRQAPPVHVVHFDGHGVYDKRLGLGHLLFETEDHKKDLVDANRLGTLVSKGGVPLIVLSACQSAMTDEEANPYASVAARLIRAGVGSVLAMNYSVLVAAAHKFTAAFYNGLAAGYSVGQAVDEGRWTLLQDINRHTIVRRNAKDELVEETIKLHDWFLPALYQQADDPRIFGADEEQLPQESAPVEQDFPRLAGQISKQFDKEELHDLCFQLEIHYDDLPGETRRRKAQELVLYVERRDSLPQLIELLAKLRPTTPWQDMLEPTAAARALHAQPAARRSPPATSPAALPLPPQHGFHGRSREMLALERAFAAVPIIVLHGFGGLGKTALAAEAGRWFTRTGRFPGGAAFVSFEGGGSLQQLCSWVGQTLSGDKDWMVHSEGEPTERLLALLAAKPALLILDNFESVLGREPLMPAQELKEMLNFVAQISDAAKGQSKRLSYRGTRVLITTRDTTFNDARFAPSKNCRHIALEGLATVEALDLAAAVLDDYGIDRAAIPRRELTALLTQLGGHPLSLNLVLPHLRDHSAAELSARFEELLPGFTQGKAVERNESLSVSLQFSLRRLGDDTRAALPDLAVFQGSCMEDDMLEITEMDAELWQMARAELEQAALLRIEQLPGIKPPFLHFHPTLLPYLSTQLDDERRAALQSRYWQRYYALVGYLYQTDTQNPHQARAIAVREMGNMRRGLELALAAEALDEAVDFATRTAKFLDNFGRWRERDEMMEKVREWARKRVAGGESAGGITKAEYLLLSRQGEPLLQQGRAGEAEALFRELLARLEAGAAYDTAYDVAVTQMRIGRCLRAQGRPSQAIAFHQQALDGFTVLSETNKSAKNMLGVVYADLADNLMDTGKFENARINYEKGLESARKSDNQRQVGVILGQLGTLALQRNDLEEAQRRHREALDTFRALGEPRMEAVAWHQLGLVSQEAQSWAEAERCYREAMRIEEENGNLPGVARTYNQLALVAQGEGRFDDAERWYLRAIELGEQLGDNQGLATRLINLADLYLSEKRLAEAEGYARRALAIVETLDLSAEPWKDYSIMAQIAAAQNRPQEAAQWRRKEQESRDAFAGTQHQIGPILQQFQGVIAGVVAVCEGNQEARAQIEGLFDTFQQGNWQIVDAIQQIWDGERDADSLTANIDYNSRAIVLAILTQLAGESPVPQTSEVAATSEVSTPQAQQEGVTLEQLLALVGQAIQPGAPEGLAPQLQALTNQMTQDPNAPPEIRALGSALTAILIGDRSPDLSALPPELADAVRGLL